MGRKPPKRTLCYLFTVQLSPVLIQLCIAQQAAEEHFREIIQIQTDLLSPAHPGDILPGLAPQWWNEAPTTVLTAETLLIFPHRLPHDFPESV